MRTFIVYCHTLKKDNRKYIGITSIKPILRWRKQGGDAMPKIFTTGTFWRFALWPH